MEQNYHSGLIANIRRYVEFSESDAKKIVSIAHQRTIKKKENIDQPGKISDYRNYVVSGAFRSYFIDEEGKEHTVQIAVDDWFVSDFYSYVTRTPATLFVEALEESEILQMHYDDIEPLCNEVHSLRTISVDLLSGHLLFQGIEHCLIFLSLRKIDILNS